MRRQSLLIPFLFVLPFLTELQVSGVWDSNEAFYVQTPREMAERGDWVVPYFNGRPRLNKPPLSYWVVGILQKLLPDPLAAERWTLALVAAGSLICCLLLSRWLTGSSTHGLLALGIFATSFRFIILSRRLLIDTLLLFCLLAALTAFVRWLLTREKMPFLLAAFFLALGFLTKGPVAFVAALVALVYLAFTRQLGILRKAPLGWAFLILLMFCLPWYWLLANRLGFAVLLDFFLLENVGRFTNLDFGPRRGLFYYFGVFLTDFLPWSVLVLASLPCWWRRLGSESQTQPAGDQKLAIVPGAGTLMACWVLIWMVVFSLSRNKQEHYILPVYPVAACWLAHWLESREVGRIWSGVAGGTVALAAVVLALLGAIFLGLPPTIWLLLAFPVGFLGFALAGRWLGAALILSFFLTTTAALFVAPMEQFRPAREFAAQIEKLAAPGARVGYFRLATPSLTVYLNQPIEEVYEPQEARQLLAARDEIWLVLEEKDLSSLQELSASPFQVIDRRPLLSTRLAHIVDRLRDPGRNERFALLIYRPPRVGR